MAKHLRHLHTELKKEKLLTLSNLFVMTLTFLVFGMFVIIVALSQTSLRRLEQEAQVTLFFKDDFSEQNIQNFRTTVEKNPKVSKAIYFSKQDAYKIFVELNKDEPTILENTSSDILPASLEVHARNINDLSQLASEYKSVDGIEDVKYFDSVIQNFKMWSSIIYIVGFALVVIFFLISYSIIVVGIRTTITSKGAELEILKLVGASDDYVRTPLVYQGVFYGGVSSAFAALILLVVGIWLNSWKMFAQGITFGFLPNVSVSPVVAVLIFSIFLIASGLSLGYFGSSTTIKKYLRY